MKIEIFDSYNIRARVCPCIILLSPIAITLFICFRDAFNAFSSATILVLLLSFANCIPIIQRGMFKKSKLDQINYAAQFLRVDDDTIDCVSKKRFYNKLSKYDSSFESLSNITNNIIYNITCESAVKLIQSKTRENKLVLEENINFGFCKNMLLNKNYGIMICCINNICIAAYTFLSNKTIDTIGKGNWIALILNTLILFFWIFIINKKMMQESGKQYAITLIKAIDSLE